MQMKKLEQVKLLKEKPTKATLDKLEAIFNKEWLFYKVFLYYESLKKKFPVKTDT